MGLFDTFGKKSDQISESRKRDNELCGKCGHERFHHSLGCGVCGKCLGFVSSGL